jgi:hypothetical protein
MGQSDSRISLRGVGSIFRRDRDKKGEGFDAVIPSSFKCLYTKIFLGFSLISSGILCGICTLFLVLGSIANAESSVPPSSSVCKGFDLLKNPFFVNPSKDFNSGVIHLKKVDLAPENWSWGFRGYAWDTDTQEQYPITECSYSSFLSGANDSDVWLCGKDDSGRLGVVTLIRGWVWQSLSPPEGWHIFSPRPVSRTNNMRIDS